MRICSLKENKKLILMILTFLVSLFPIIVKADGRATTGMSGNSSVYVGNNIEVILYVNSVSGTTNNEGLAAFDGNISYSTDKLELISTSSLAPFTIDRSGNKIAGISFGATIKGYSNIMKFVFRAKSTGSATVSYSGASVPDASAVPVSVSSCSKTINIVNPPSSNANLSSLSVSVGSISFNKNTTSYSVSVDSNVTSAVISAQAEDGGSTIWGTGSKSLGYGNNSFSIVVTAPSGAQKTYTININRKDTRSGNNNLRNLKLNNGSLEPGFSKGTTKYSVSVPYEVSSLKISADAEDSKAKVSISGNNNLVAEETTDVTVTVTAENGSQKTYTISVTRGKDPNKKLSNNNFLTHITPSIGILSPVFNKETLDYEIWLPYEVDKINFDYGVEDTKYAKVKFEGNDVLIAGTSNLYKIIVSAENEEKREYKISVKRAKNPTENGSGNTYLKSIKLKNGRLTSNFNKEKREYTYTKKKGFEVSNVIPENSDSAVNITKNGDTIYLIVMSSNGEYGVYTLRLEETNIISYLIYLLLFIIGVGFGYFIRTIVKNRKKEINKVDKEIKVSKSNNKKKDEK